MFSFFVFRFLVFDFLHRFSILMFDSWLISLLNFLRCISFNSAKAQGQTQQRRQCPPAPAAGFAFFGGGVVFGLVYLYITNLGI
jgi:hypothetical protein